MTFSSRLVGGAVGTSRAADKLTDTSKIGSGLANYGEDVIAPWLARTAQADHIGGKALRGLGWIGKQHSKIPGYDWMEGQLANLGGAAAGALNVDPRIGMLVGTIVMPDFTDFVPGVGGALKLGGKGARKGVVDAAQRTLSKYSDAKLYKGMTTAQPAIPLRVKDRMPRINPKTGKPRYETVDGVRQFKRYKLASEQLPADIPRRYLDLLPETAEEAAGLSSRKIDVSQIKPDDTLRQGVSDEWNRLLDDRNAIIDTEWVKYMDIVDELDNWPVDELGNPIIKKDVAVSKGGKMKPFEKSYTKYSHVESRRINQLRKIRDLRSSPINAAVQGFINNFQEGYDRAMKGVPGAKPGSGLGLEQHHAWANIEGSTFTAMLDQVGRAHKLDAWRHIAQTYGTVPGYGLANMWNLPGKKTTKVHQKLHSWLRDLGFEEYWRDLNKARPNMQAPEQMARIDEFFETVYYPSLMRTALMMAVDPSAKLDLVNLPKGMLKKEIAAQKDGAVKVADDWHKLSPRAQEEFIEAAYRPGGAATRKGWWATPEQLEMLELYVKEMP